MEYWENLSITNDIPILFLRFEDMITNKEQAMNDCFAFLLGQQSIDGTYIQKRI